LRLRAPRIDRGTIAAEVTIHSANDSLTSTHSSPPSGRHLAIAALCFVSLVDLFTRINWLGTSLWLDEFGTLWDVEAGFSTMVRRTWDGQIPLYFSLVWASVHAFGESEFALRLPSLLLSCLTVAVLYWCGRILSGPRAGLYAAALFWFSASNLRYSVEARPYILVLCMVAVAIAGFVGAVQTGSWRARMMWILGGAAVAWTHYVHYPVIVGMFMAYTLLPSLRVQYPVRAFIPDAAVQLALVGLCAPRIFALYNGRAVLSWIDEPHYGVFLEPVVPLVAGIVVGLIQPWPRDDAYRTKAALGHALLICVLFHIVAIESALIVGVNLLNIRYFVSILIPATLFVAMTLARAGIVAVVSILSAFVLATAVPLIAVKHLTGTFSQIGFENWRGAVRDLSVRIRNDPEPVVFLRSGFVDQDTVPLGTPPETSLAPLRSPGETPFTKPVIHLNYRWLHPARERYFEERIAPAIVSTSHFFVLGETIDPSGSSYMTRFIHWVDSRWPARFTVTRTRYGTIELLEFSGTHSALRIDPRHD